MGDQRKPYLGISRVQQPCDLCGDIGFHDKIVTCFQCQITSLHAYCMREPLYNIPEIWICEECIESNEKAQSRNSNIVPDDTLQSVVSSGREPIEDSGRLKGHKKKVDVGIGKVKCIPSHEAIKLPSGSRKIQKSSSSKLCSSSGQSGNMTMLSTTAITTEFKPEVSELQRVQTNADVTLNRHLMSLGKDGGKHSLFAQPRERRMEDKNNPLVHQGKCVKEEPVDNLKVEISDSISTVRKGNKHALKEEPDDAVTPAKRTSHSTVENTIKHSFRKESADMQMVLRRVETYESTEDTAIKDVFLKEAKDVQMDAKKVETLQPASEEDFKFTPLTSSDALPVIGSGRSLVMGITARGLGFKGSNLPKTLHTKDPVAEAIWSGSIEIVHSASRSSIYDGFLAYFPGRVHRKAFEFSKQLPVVLRFEVVPSNIMLEAFQNECPCVDDIALYFLPGNVERSNRQYELLGLIEVKNLVLRSHLNGVDFLLSPSKWPDVEFQGSKSFLWGFYYRPTSKS